MQDRGIVILGAGPAGCTAALSLSQKGIPATLIDRSDFPRDKICGDALSGKVISTLERINPAFVSELGQLSSAKESHGVIFYAPNGKPLRVPFRREKDLNNPPGFISRRMDFDHWLFRKASHAPGIDVYTGLSMEKFHKEGKGWIIEDEKGSLRIRTPLLLVSDGAQSRFARKTGLINLEPNHYCAGLRAYVSDVKGLDENGFIELHFLKEFLPGYFWIFPLPGGYANVGIGMRSDVIAKKKINLKKELTGLLKNHPQLKSRFIESKIEGDILGYGLPLGSRKRKISGDGFMLLGDAASLIDPFTGEGIGNGMISGLKAAETIAECNNDFREENLCRYDESVYRRLWPELSLSKRMQELVRYPRLFNLIVNKARRSETLQETISCMFEDMDIRNKLRDPRFYLKVLME